VTIAMQAVYPVGSIYINAGSSTNPNTLLGFGTWTAFGAGRVMVGLNGSDTLFDALEETGGSKDAIVVSHSHSASSSVSDPGHSHPIQRTSNDGNFTTAFDVPSDGPANTYFTNTSAATTGISVSTSVGTTGSSGTNANLPPYITVAMWKRTA
jgi:microcystin-dependent protein